MSENFQDNMRCRDLVFNLPNHLVISLLNKKRWHLAVAKINCSRVLLSLFNEVVSKNNKINSILPASASFLINIEQPRVNSGCFSNVNQTILSKVVKEKNLDELFILGGGKGIAVSLKSDANRGIDGAVEDRRKEFGTNTYIEPPTKGFFLFVFEAFKGSNYPYSIGLRCPFSWIRDQREWAKRRQSRQFDKLSKVSNNITVEVVRNGRRQQVSIFDIVVGDIVCLKIGDQVPADGLFLDGHSLQVDESSMTGESDHVEINRDRNPFLFSGTKVTDGYARMLITSVGMNTTWGEMMSTISQDSNEQTPLQARLNKLTSSIGKAIQQTKMGIKSSMDLVRLKVDDVINGVLRIIAAAVTIVVVAIPEGLPLAVTLTLAYSMKRMMADQAMVRRLSACETMGSATTICTDKTGTLTLNQMKITKFWLGKECIEGKSYVSIAANVLELLHQGVGLNTTGSVYMSSASGLEFYGSPTEKAILSWAVHELNMDTEKVKQNCSIPAC
ncbi:putative calcium-transporting ATPase 13 [Abeliophyllum distichum]|uniref:Calcium-transporting ATPase 13 n=1 Tax=Abeliophyllum distichum TaxID=126358 RepID=A0ABD1T258_9LAMI